MYFYTLSVKMGGIYTARGNTFAEACNAVGIDPNKTQVIKVVNA